MDTPNYTAEVWNPQKMASDQALRDRSDVDTGGRASTLGLNPPRLSSLDSEWRGYIVSALAAAERP